MITVSPAPGAIGADDPGSLMTFARQADVLGFDLLLLGYGDDRVDLEPLTSAAALCAVTRRIGLCAKATTRLGEPFTLARGFAALDHLSGGRAAWQVATRIPDRALPFAHRPSVAPADEDALAREFLDTTFALWDSWRADALTFDKQRAEFSNPEAVHSVDHEGRFFSVRGPLNTPRPRQGRPVIVHPPATDMEWAAATGDVLIVGVEGAATAAGSLAADVAGDPEIEAEMRNFAARCRQSALARQRRIRLLLETRSDTAVAADARARRMGLDGLHVVSTVAGLSALASLAEPARTDAGTLRERCGVPL